MLRLYVEIITHSNDQSLSNNPRLQQKYFFQKMSPKGPFPTLVIRNTISSLTGTTAQAIPAAKHLKVK